MMLTHEQETVQFSPVQGDDAVPGSGVQEAPEWIEIDAVPSPGKLATPRPHVTPGHDLETDNLVAQYFGDVRRFDLLNLTEERALWRRIEHLQARLRRALYTSPVALPTLTRVWHQVRLEEIPLKQVLHDSGVTPEEQTAQQARLCESVAHLQDLAKQVEARRGRAQKKAHSPQARRAQRQQRVQLWQQWIDTCEALALHPNVHQAMRQALETERQVQPHGAGVRAAHRAWWRAQQQLEQAKEQMMHANLRLVIHLAKRYREPKVPLLDLIQEGNIGLMRAIEKFEPQRGLKFVTYAHWWVRQAISRALVEQHRTVRVPGYMVDRQSKLKNMVNRLWATHGRPPSVQELSTTLGWTPEEIHELQTIGQTALRLHEPIMENGRALADSIEDTQAPQPDERLVENQLQQCIAASLGSLPEREAVILRLRYGLETDHAHSLQEIADIFGLSRERVRQLERKALGQLRSSQSWAFLEDFANI